MAQKTKKNGNGPEKTNGKMTRGKDPLNDTMAGKKSPKTSKRKTKKKQETKVVDKGNILEVVNEGNILDYVKNKLRNKDGASLLQESLGDLWLDIIVAQTTPEDIKKITDSIYGCVYALQKAGIHSTVHDLLDAENLKKLFLSKPQKADQLHGAMEDLCERGEEFPAVVQDFFQGIYGNPSPGHQMETAC
jgi:hypothetical protein